jgi:hypothetical protein
VVRAGTKLAVFGLMGPVLSACLILEPIEFDDRQLPAHLDSPEPFTFAQVLDTPDLACEGLGIDGMLFSARVSDANANENLEGRLIVNGGVGGGEVVFVQISTSGTFDRGVHWGCVPREKLQRRCNRVEMLVTSAFSPDRFPYGTRDPNDVAKLEWWVLGPASSTPNADQSDCADYLEDELP